MLTEKAASLPDRERKEYAEKVNKYSHIDCPAGLNNDAIDWLQVALSFWQALGGDELDCDDETKR